MRWMRSALARYGTGTTRRISPTTSSIFAGWSFGNRPQWNEKRLQLHELLRDAQQRRNRDAIQPKVEELAGQEDDVAGPTTEGAGHTPPAEAADLPPEDENIEAPFPGEPDPSDVEIESPAMAGETLASAETSAEPEQVTEDEPAARIILLPVAASRPQPSTADYARRKLARWAVGMCLVTFAAGYVWYRWPHDLRFPKIAFREPAPPPTPISPPKLAPPITSQIEPTTITPTASVPAQQPKTPAHPLAESPNSPTIATAAPITPPSPPEVIPPKPLEKARACIVGDADIRDIFALEARRTISGKIVTGDCSAVEAPIIRVAGFASTPGATDPACKTIDQHLYELAISISRSGGPDISRTVVGSRCSSRVRDEDLALGREAKNQAVLIGVISLRDLLQQLSEN